MNRKLISVIIPCHNAGKEALRAVRAIGKLNPPSGWTLEALVVDDASTDNTAALLTNNLPAWAHLIETAQNLGRSGARNLGAAAAHGSYLLLLDCDCLPQTSDFLARHLEVVDGSADASIGDVVGIADGFWGRYGSDAAVRRSRKIKAGGAGIFALTTANVMIRADAFKYVSGFDERYRHYGFEDRDFLLRLRDNGARLRHNLRAPVAHSAILDLPTICLKMRECGTYSSPLFRTTHPNAYRKLGYATIDAQLHPWLHVVGLIIGPLILGFTSKIERWLHQGFWPYWLRAGVARGATAIAYLEGTRTAERRD